MPSTPIIPNSADSTPQYALRRPAETSPKSSFVTGTVCLNPQQKVGTPYGYGEEVLWWWRGPQPRHPGGQAEGPRGRVDPRGDRGQTRERAAVHCRTQLQPQARGCQEPRRARG